MIIGDGKGTGYTAGVNSEHRLLTFSITEVEQIHAIEEGNAYILDIDSVVVDGDGYNFVYIQNNDTHNLVIATIILWVATNKDDSNVEVWLGHTLSSAANYTAVTPTNLNAGSGNAASGTFYVNDGGGNLTTLAGGSIAGRWKPRATMDPWTPAPHWIIPENQTLVLTCTKDNTFRGYISFYYHE